MSLRDRFAYGSRITDNRLLITDYRLRGRFYQTAKQAKHGRYVVDEVFGVPLHADGIGMANHLYAFDEAIGGNGRCPQLVGQAANPLVVQAVDGRFRHPQLPRQQRVWFDGNLVRQVVTRMAFDVFMVHRLGHELLHVFPERAAQGHVEHLQAPADGQEGFC